LVALGATGQEHRCHAGAHTHRKGGDIGLDHLDGVVDSQPGIHNSPRRIDVELDVLVRVLMSQEEHLGDDQVGDLIIDRSTQEDDAVLQQPRVDVERSLTPVRAFDDHRDEIFNSWDVHVVGFLFSSRPPHHPTEPTRRRRAGWAQYCAGILLSVASVVVGTQPGSSS
jgi:hypothetical protein